MLALIRFILSFFAGLLFTLMSFIGLAVACLLLLIFYCSYRLIWLFSGTAAVARSKRKFEHQRNKLIHHAYRQRKHYSSVADRQDIIELRVQIEQQLQNHQLHIDAHLVNELYYLLSRYEQDLNFDKTLHIHAIVTKTDASSLNTTITELLNDSTNLN